MTSATTRLQRVLDVFATELAEAPSTEVAEVLQELGIKPDMKGSVIWVGVLNLYDVRQEYLRHLEKYKKRSREPKARRPRPHPSHK